MIASQWRNVATVITSVVLMLFAMVQIIAALALNLRSDLWVDHQTVSTVPGKTRMTTGINILIDSLFIFPAAWAGICAAVSRHRGVYITLVVIVSLAFLGAIGGLIDIAWEFGSVGLFKDTGVNDEIAISLLVLQCMLVIMTLLLMTFGIVALLYDCPDHPQYKHRENLLDKPPNYNRMPTYNASPYLSYQGPGYTSAQPPPPRDNATSAYRPLTKGSPEWDRFYEQYFGNSQSYRDRKSKSKSRAHSYRY